MQTGSPVFIKCVRNHQNNIPKERMPMKNESLVLTSPKVVSASLGSEGSEMDHPMKELCIVFG